MNHRELVLSARKAVKFHFLQLPEELQDQIIEGLDQKTVTLESAAELVRSKGFSLSHEAIAGYYRAVRRERRLHDANQELSRMISGFADQPMEEGLKGLSNLIISMAAVGLADGSVGIKDIDLAKVLAALPEKKNGQEKPEEEAPKQPQSKEDLIRKIREEIYGL